MKNTITIAAFCAAIILAGVTIAVLLYRQAGPGPATRPVAAPAVSGRIAASSPASSPTPRATAAPRAPASERPVVYVPIQSVPSSTPRPLGAGPTPGPQAVEHPLATLAPSDIMPPVVRQPPDAPPRILAMSLSSPVAGAGDVVSGVVETSSNVASVQARIGGYAASMRKVGVGRFQLSYRVPYTPFFLHRTYTIEVIARNSHGDAATSQLPITVR